jgi:hypothetical protein
MTYLCIALAILNLTLNAFWLYAGDLRVGDSYFFMSWGWSGFWITTGLSACLLAAGTFLLLSKKRVPDRDT